jgi:uncharacterized membrane protein YkvA (DUF1232 family)
VMNVKDDFYQNLRVKIREWLTSNEGKENKYAEYLLFAPDMFHLLCKLALDSRVPVQEKAKLAVAIAYFITPVDMVPEILMGPIGYVDDMALAAFVLNSIVNNTDHDIVKEHWAGEGDVLELIQLLLKKADEMVGKGLWSKLKGLVK